VKLTIDTDAALVQVTRDGVEQTYPLASPEAFQLVSAAWVRAGWDTKYVYSFSWLGRPIIQLPEDMIRIQEIIYRLKPDVILETGIAHGGSLVFYASLCKAMGKGRVIGIDIEIRPHNRAAIEAHELFGLLTLIEGSAVDPVIVSQAAAQIQPGETVLVLLDSNHSKAHVLAEMAAYAPLVSPGSYLLVADGIMGQLEEGAPRSQPDWAWNNPAEAAKEFVAAHPDFVLEEPAFPFNEGLVQDRVTYWPSGIIRRRS
jgi:cephalosporin hydroxylase